MTELKVVQIEQNHKSDENVVERIEEALALAKEGRVSNFIGIFVLKSGDTMDCWANGNNPVTMVGALESVKREFMDACIEKRGV